MRSLNHYLVGGAKAIHHSVVIACVSISSWVKSDSHGGTVKCSPKIFFGIPR